MRKQITVFTDGSSRGNPGPGGWGAVIASDINVYELAGHEEKTTNNRMELSAVLEALRFLQAHNQTESSIQVNTDSQYFKNGFEKWMYGWQKNGWVTSKKEPVLNQDLWQQLFDIKPVFSSITINHVRGHVGIPGNERADDLATTAADEGVLNLYRGNRNSYPVDLSSNTISNKKPGAKSGKAFCYLSMVGGVIQEHKTWAECQARVKGKSRPKFRKATSLAERDQIIKSWQSEQVT